MICLSITIYSSGQSKLSGSKVIYFNNALHLRISMWFFSIFSCRCHSLNWMVGLLLLLFMYWNELVATFPTPLLFSDEQFILNSSFLFQLLSLFMIIFLLLLDCFTLIGILLHFLNFLIGTRWIFCHCFSLYLSTAFYVTVIYIAIFLNDLPLLTNHFYLFSIALLILVLSLLHPLYKPLFSFMKSAFFTYFLICISFPLFDLLFMPSGLL